MMTNPKTHTAGEGRVSPTATEDQSTSTAVWRLLENDPKFVAGMARAKAEHDRGEFTKFRPGRRPKR